MTATETLADQAYFQLRTAIATGELPSGEKVTERGMAERLAMSPTPIREALRRLELDGLIERIGPRMVLVAAIRDAAIDDLAEVEVGLRGLVARFAARHATADQLDALDAILDRADDLLILLKQSPPPGSVNRPAPPPVARHDAGVQRHRERLRAQPGAGPDARAEPGVLPAAPPGTAVAAGGRRRDVRSRANTPATAPWSGHCARATPPPRNASRCRTRRVASPR